MNFRYFYRLNLGIYENCYFFPVKFYYQENSFFFNSKMIVSCLNISKFFFNIKFSCFEALFSKKSLISLFNFETASVHIF